MRNVGFQPAEALSVWVVTDGRAGIENQALGLAEAIGRRAPIRLTTKRVSMRTPWRWLPAGFVPFPRQAMTIASDELSPPWPDIWIGCGRASIPYSMGVRRWSNGRTFVAQLQDPRINVREFDVVIPPIHDKLEGQNLLSIMPRPILPRSRAHLAAKASRLTAPTSSKQALPQRWPAASPP